MYIHNLYYTVYVCTFICSNCQQCTKLINAIFNVRRDERSAVFHGFLLEEVLRPNVQVPCVDFANPSALCRGDDLPRTFSEHMMSTLQGTLAKQKQGKASHPNVYYCIPLSSSSEQEQERLQQLKKRLNDHDVGNIEEGLAMCMPNFSSHQRYFGSV